MPQPEFDIGELVLYKNNQLIAFNKPAGLPVATDKTGDKAMDQLGEIYCKSKLGLVHRLDRPASGAVLFARSENALAHLNAQFRERQVEKIYLVAVAEKPAEASGTLTHYIKRDGRQNKAILMDGPGKGAKQAELSYRYLQSSERYHLLEVRLHTGRHHQIRAQLASIGCPIKGDVKYGFRRSNPDRSIHLHAWKLTFKHPVSKQTETITAPLPQHDPVWAAFNLND